MPSLGSLVLRYFSVFAVTIVISFFAMALAIGFLGLRVSGLLPFVLLLAISILSGATSTGRLIGRSTGDVPGEIFTLIVALLCSSSVLTALAMFLVQSKSSGWLTELPSPDDPAAQDILVKGAGIFLGVATVLTRFGLIYGSRAGMRDYLPSYHQMPVVEVPPEIYHSPYGYTHPQNLASSRRKARQPGVLFLLLWLIGLSLLGIAVFTSIGAAFESTGRHVTKQVLLLVIATPFSVPYFVGMIYANKTGCRIPVATSMISSGLFSIFVLSVTTYWLLTHAPNDSVSIQGLTDPEIVRLLALGWLALTGGSVQSMRRASKWTAPAPMRR